MLSDLFWLAVLAIAIWFGGSYVTYWIGNGLSKLINSPFTPEWFDTAAFKAYQKVMALSLWLNEKTKLGPWL